MSLTARTIVPVDPDDDEVLEAIDALDAPDLLGPPVPARPPADPLDAPPPPQRTPSPAVPRVQQPAPQPEVIELRLRRAGLVREGEPVEIVTDAPPPVRERVPPRPGRS